MVLRSSIALGMMPFKLGWIPRFRIYPDFFYLSPYQDRLEKLGSDQDGNGNNLGGCFYFPVNVVSSHYWPRVVVGS